VACSVDQQQPVCLQLATKHEQPVVSFSASDSVRCQTAELSRWQLPPIARQSEQKHASSTPSSAGNTRSEHEYSCLHPRIYEQECSATSTTLPAEHELWAQCQLHGLLQASRWLRIRSGSGSISGSSSGLGSEQYAVVAAVGSTSSPADQHDVTKHSELPADVQLQLLEHQRVRPQSRSDQSA
jgi:hypothetical protein